MLYPRAHKQQSQEGFTLVELVVVMVLTLLVGAVFMTVFRSSVYNFVNMQSDATASVQMNTQANRIGMVLRGSTGIVSASGNDLVLYSYFYPSDSYVSLLHYYLQTTGGVTSLKADLTPMSANPPIGTPQIAQKKTFSIIDSYYQASGVNLFTYLDSSGNPIASPVSELQTIKGIQVTLAAKTSSNTNQTMSVQVSLRNRKTNL